MIGAQPGIGAIEKGDGHAFVESEIMGTKQQMVCMWEALGVCINVRKSQMQLLLCSRSR